MKTFKFLALSAIAFAAASCSTDDAPLAEQQQTSELKPINIGTYVSGTSRAARISDYYLICTGDHSNPKLYTPFQDAGFLLYANVNTDNGEKPTPLMEAQQISWTPDAANPVTYDHTTSPCTATLNGEWTYSPLKYWPAESNATVDFYPRWVGAEASDAENIKLTYDWNYIPQVTFYVNDDVSKQTDFLWAEPLLGKKYSDFESSENKVAINFKHALSGFIFYLKMGAGYPKSTTKTKVNSITLTGYFAPKARLKPYETDITKIWDLEGDYAKRSYTISKKGVEISNNTDYSTSLGQVSLLNYSATGVKYRGTIMVLPFKNAEYTITMDYTVTSYPTAADKAADTNGHTQTYKVSKDVTGVNLEPGKIYKNDIELNLNGIQVTANAETWDATTTNTVTIE